MTEFRPKRSFSQNFLVDRNLARKIVAALELREGDAVLEAGPGQGALTRELLACGARVVAVELDGSVLPLLRQQVGDHPNLTVLSGDILAVDFDALGLPREGARFVSNLPYGITSPVLVRLVASRFPFERVVLTVQKEVALRLVAPPGGRDYGRLTVMLSLWGRCERLFDLPPSVFRPRPTVVSTALRLWPEVDRWLPAADAAAVELVVRCAFATRRKTLATSLTHSLALSRPAVVAWLDRAAVAPTLRAERLAPDDFVRLARSMPPEARPAPRIP